MKQLGNLILKINNMTNKTTTLVLGWLFLIAGFFSSYGVNIICSSIFFSAHFIIETLDKNGGKEN